MPDRSIGHTESASSQFRLYLPLSAALRDRSTLSMFPVGHPTWVSNFREQSLSRELCIARRPGNSLSKQLTNGTLRAPEV
jgi:hypothetical protein